MNHEISPITVTIKSGQTKSNPFYVGNAIYVGVIFPATLDGTTMDLLVSHHPTTGFVKEVSTGTKYQFELADVKGGAVYLDKYFNAVSPYSNFQLEAGTAQTADRTFIIVGKG